ncbi:MAG: hypothetical protein B6244_10225 [Candidatus Cloacimonetes bacterium 4572_55]|nr:MAG: hypothetical protein B6244_10225 [Candidatus Cloacimonetes bacterium 4572_55]
MKVMIIEDDRHIQQLLARFIGAFGNKTTTCSIGEKAVENFRNQFYPLIILDLGLPDIDGLEVCRRIRGLPRGDECVILVCTAYTRPRDLEAVLGAGADDYLAKPINFDLLRVRLKIAEQRVRAQPIGTVSKKKKTRSHELFENADAMIQCVDSGGAFTYVNHTWCRVLGYSEEELYNLSIIDVIHPKDLARYEAEFKNLILDEKCGKLELRFIAKNHKTVFVSGTLNSEQTGNGALYAKGIFRDMTRYKEIEKQLEKAQAEERKQRERAEVAEQEVKFLKRLLDQ